MKNPEKQKVVGKYPAICSILPRITMIYDPEAENDEAEIGRLAEDAIKWGKWTVDNLVSCKRDNGVNEPWNQKVIYMVDEEDQIDIKNLRSFDYENTEIPKTTEDSRYILLDKCLEIHKKFVELGLKHQGVRALIDHAVGSAYALTSKLNYYLNKFGNKNLRPTQDYEKRYGKLKVSNWREKE